jgi:hypothetical protein
VFASASRPPVFRPARYGVRRRSPAALVPFGRLPATMMALGSIANDRSVRHPRS